MSHTTPATKKRYCLIDQDRTPCGKYEDMYLALAAADEIPGCGVVCSDCNEGVSARSGCRCSQMMLEEALAVVKKDKAEKAALKKALRKALKKLREIAELKKQTRSLLNPDQLKKVLKMESWENEREDLIEKLPEKDVKELTEKFFEKPTEKLP